MRRPAGHWIVTLGSVVCATPAHAQEDADGSYGRLEGDLTLSIEAGASAALRSGESASGSLAARAGTFYLHTVGLIVQYNDALELEEAPLARSIVGAIELRPLFLGRFAQDMERGPAHLDLFADSFGLGLGIYGSWQSERQCVEMPMGRLPRPCRDLGMELSVGAEIPFLGRANSPFVGLRAAVRWSLVDAPPLQQDLPPQLMLTLSFGYHHVLLVHLVDAGDRPAAADR
jgi:hypothetical protein